MKTYYEPVSEDEIRYSAFAEHLAVSSVTDKEYDLLCKDAQAIFINEEAKRWAEIVTAVRKASRKLYKSNGQNASTDSYVELNLLILGHSVTNPLLSHIPRWILETLKELSEDSRESIKENEFLDTFIKKMLGPCDRLTDRLIDCSRQIKQICQDNIDTIPPLPMYVGGLDGYIDFTAKLERLLPRRENRPSK